MKIIEKKLEHAKKFYPIGTEILSIMNPQLKAVVDGVPYIENNEIITVKVITPLNSHEKLFLFNGSHWAQIVTPAKSSPQKKRPLIGGVIRRKLNKKDAVIVDCDEYGFTWRYVSGGHNRISSWTYFDDSFETAPFTDSLVLDQRQKEEKFPAEQASKSDNDKAAVVKFFADRGVPDGIIPGDEVIVENLKQEGFPNKFSSQGSFVGVCRGQNVDIMFLVESQKGVVFFGDTISRLRKKKSITSGNITNCPFFDCTLNSGGGTCHSTNTKQCDSVPEQFKER